MIYFVDFDSTICHSSGEPKESCVRFLKELKRRNHIIFLYSCRSNPECVANSELATQDMINFMQKYNIPYDHIQYGKPFFNFLIDDRAIGVPLDKTDSVDWDALWEITEKKDLW